MLNILKITLFLLVISVVTSCSSGPETINYGKENCEFCKMTIMDKKFGTELVSQKGKVFKFDDAACMVKYMQVSNQEDAQFKFIVFNGVDAPGELLGVEEATFVYSGEMRSPMLGNVGAFKDPKKANDYLKSDTTAQMMSWEEVKSKLE